MIATVAVAGLVCAVIILAYMVQIERDQRAEAEHAESAAIAELYVHGAEPGAPWAQARRELEEARRRQQPRQEAGVYYAPVDDESGKRIITVFIN